MKVLVKQKVTVTNPTGLQLSTAAVLSNYATKFDSMVEFEFSEDAYDYGIANMKSILNIVGAGIVQNQEITVTCTGEDEDEALQAIVTKIHEDGIGE